MVFYKVRTYKQNGLFQRRKKITCLRRLLKPQQQAIRLKQTIPIPTIAIRHHQLIGVHHQMTAAAMIVEVRRATHLLSIASEEVILEEAVQMEDFNMKTTEIIRNIFVDTIGVDEGEVKAETTNNELGMDSLVKVHVIVAIEDHFGIEFSDDDMDACKQFSDYVAMVERKVKV